MQSVSSPQTTSKQQNNQTAIISQSLLGGPTPIALSISPPFPSPYDPYRTDA
jgi:hypothetical protein